MRRSRRLGLLTYRSAPDLTPDDQNLLAPLKEAGFDPFPIIWSDVAPASIDADLLVIRSTWDYFLDPNRFLAWLSELDSTGTTLLNSSATVRWNMRKDYLFQLQSSGIEIPRTILLHGWHPGELAPFMGAPVVVKPVVSAGAHNTHRFVDWTPESIEGHIRTMLEQGPLLVQEYLKEVEKEGEWSFIFLGRTFSHSVIKVAAPSDFRVQEHLGGTLSSQPPDLKILEQVRAILAKIPDELLYARVDGVVRSGRFVLMELELFEPSLYLSFEPRAAQMFATTLSRMTENHGHRR